MLEGKPDYSKGSYYANPLYDVPFSDESLVKKYPSFCHPNIWPSDDVPDLETHFKALGKLIVQTGLLVAKQCDKYAKKQINSYPENRLFTVINESKTCKARLLHYFPVDNLTVSDSPAEPNGDDISSWCGWHNDHGSLTGLIPAMYVTKEGNPTDNPDPHSGLYVRSRTGNVVQVKIPAHHLAFQIGETAQIHSGGVLQATPHCVRAAQGDKARGISRETFAVFMEPMWDEKMSVPEGSNIENILKSTSSTYLPHGVPTLGSRWNPEMDFGQFTDATLKSYY